jgi:hypothetical protein
MAIATAPNQNQSATDQRRALLKEASRLYFEGIAKKDMSAVPYDDSVVLRSPLAPEGINVPLRGRQAVLDWFASLWPVTGETQEIEHYFDEDLSTIATRANVGIVQPPVILRVTDRFKVNAEGKIVQQENHYDPKGASLDQASDY